MGNRTKIFTDIEDLRSDTSLWFSINEAYKTIRTNLMFSLPEELNKSKIVGITSSIVSEGKTTTSINLAKSLAEQGENTLLVECDMRLPNIGRRLGINPNKGFSNLILGQYTIDETIISIENHFDIITAGTIPPNPSELLGSKRFEYLIGELRKKYEYIIVDLPPVTVVSDPLVVARSLDGIILIVRQDSCRQKDLDIAVQSLSVVNDKVLGFVMTGTSLETKTSYKKSRYQKDYYRYVYSKTEQLSENINNLDSNLKLEEE